MELKILRKPLSLVMVIIIAVTSAVPAHADTLLDVSWGGTTVTTAPVSLADFLLQNNLASGDVSAFGLMVDTVLGEHLDYNTDGAWWAFFVNGADPGVGVSYVTLTAGETYALQKTPASEYPAVLRSPKLTLTVKEHSDSSSSNSSGSSGASGSSEKTPFVPQTTQATAKAYAKSHYILRTPSDASVSKFKVSEDGTVHVSDILELSARQIAILKNKGAKKLIADLNYTTTINKKKTTQTDFRFIVDISGKLAPMPMGFGAKLELAADKKSAKLFLPDNVSDASAPWDIQVLAPELIKWEPEGFLVKSATFHNAEAVSAKYKISTGYIRFTTPTRSVLEITMDDTKPEDKEYKPEL